MEIEIQCEVCRSFHTVKVNREDYKSWQGGVKIQEAMPYLTKSESELIISEMCEKCYLEMMNFGIGGSDENVAIK